ncbi:RagB/SusD family nutrient uptake outer membrane protein [Faecalibacter macacae]|uniref:RagB/SusD family nutrient uptake outer membrane protein n=1 Tax=Faecalibacter macacae TaxID=1859289 RepID=A0A3L9M5I7_9FLAO|nr:RagB/SusD family nutrient uptake outer membrane protein [Faecalibacter macacae]RLZ08305.1 RagB/SusD family nutrient uptake outer membrane protein [Faecalibacter macacae]
MKKFKITFLALTVLLSFNSCSDDDIMQDSPTGTDVENFYQTQTDFTRAILGVYQGFKQSGFYAASNGSSDINVLGDILADDVIFNTNGRQANRLASTEWEYDGNMTPTSKYNSSYNIIMRANLILAKIDNLSEGSFKNQIKGEALALRALVHLEVARTYAKIPTQSADALASQGIPYVDTYDPFATPGREENIQVVYNKIIRDFTEALSNLNTSNGTDRINVNTVQALLARTYLYLGDYNKVIEYAVPVVNQVNPVTRGQLTNMWKGINSNGVLFEIPFVLTNDPAIGVSYSQGISDANINMEYSVDKRFYELFNQETEPERIAANFKLFNPANANGRQTIAVNKYILGNPATNIPGVNNGRYLRVEETILDLAEAQYLSGNQAAALVTLNKLRDNRYTTYQGGEIGTAIIDAILLERRKELAFETGDRWFTLKRLQNVNVPAEYREGVKRSGNSFYADGLGAAPVGQVLAPSSHKWQLPIDQGTINRNPNMTQTSGY